MKLTDKEEMSEWAYWQCIDGNDTQEMRNLITDSDWAFRYCYYIKDIEEMWSRIKDDMYSYFYCRYIKDRPEVRKYINNQSHLKILEKLRRK